MDIKIIKNQNPKPKPDESTLGFGQYFTDHMFMMDYTRAEGWHDARIVPFANLELHPACTVFHYGAELFEGLKAYRTSDGQIQLFRPDANFARMNVSAERMRLPLIDEEFALKALCELIKLDADWVPHAPGTSLYIRPFLFGADPKLGVHSIDHSVFVIILSPVGSYYKEGINPVRIMIETEDVRAVRGGTGYTKCGGNYGASNRAGEKAEQAGFSQVLWLDGIERKYIEEVGAMNVMFKINGEVVTPALNGTILPGVTRRSILELLRDGGAKVSERLISIDEIIEALENGTLEEGFGCGTAAVVSPIGELYYNGKSYIINDGKIGETTQKLYDELTSIQWGKKTDTHGWIYPVN